VLGIVNSLISLLRRITIGATTTYYAPDLEGSKAIG
jgi:hypothetical protein